MAIHDVFSNFKITGWNLFLRSEHVLEVNGWATLPQDQSVGTTTTMLLKVLDEAVTNITSIEIRYTDLNDPESRDFYQDPIFTANNSTLDPGNLGNTVLNIDTGLPIEFPYDTVASGPLNIIVNVPNPAGHFKNVFIVINEDAGNNVSITGTCYIGPLRRFQAAEI